MDNNPIKGLITVGQTYSYKELCEAVNDKYCTSGNTKKAQLKKWQRYFNWEYEVNTRGKQTKKMVITEIYDTPLPEEDGRRCEYDVSDIILMLINGYNFTYYDEKEDLYSMGITKTKMNELVGLCNEEYIRTMSTPINGIPLPTHKDFFSSTNSSFESIIKSNLNAMQRKNILVYSEGQLWYEEVLDEQYNSKRVYHLASDKEHTIIRKARYFVLKQWNEQYNTQLNTYGEIFYKLNLNEQQDFESRVNTIIKQNEGMERYIGSYACHKITFSKAVINTELEKRQLTLKEQQFLMRTLRKEVNEQMVTKVLTSSKQRYDKALEKQKQQNTVIEREHGFGKSAVPMSRAMQQRLEDEKYVEHCNEIAGIVIPLSEE